MYREMVGDDPEKQALLAALEAAASRLQELEAAVKAADRNYREGSDPVSSPEELVRYQDYTLSFDRLNSTPAYAELSKAEAALRKALEDPEAKPEWVVALQREVERQALATAEEAVDQARERMRDAGDDLKALELATNKWYQAIRECLVVRKAYLGARDMLEMPPVG